MSLTPAQVAQMQQPVFGAAVLAEMHFTTGLARYTSWGHDLVIGGVTWVGLPSKLIRVSGIQEAETLEYPALTLSLSLPDPGILALAQGSEKTYRGRLIRLRLAVFDEVLRLVDEPQLLWVGVMDQLPMSTGDGVNDKGSISLRCEQPGKDSRNAMSQRLTDQQHRRRYPNDTGLSRLAELSGGPQTWLTRKFQQQ